MKIRNFRKNHTLQHAIKFQEKIIIKKRLWQFKAKKFDIYLPKKFRRFAILWLYFLRFFPWCTPNFGIGDSFGV